MPQENQATRFICSRILQFSTLRERMLSWIWRTNRPLNLSQSIQHGMQCIHFRPWLKKNKNETVLKMNGLEIYISISAEFPYDKIHHQQEGQKKIRSYMSSSMHQSHEVFFMKQWKRSSPWCRRFWKYAKSGPSFQAFARFWLAGNLQRIILQWNPLLQATKIMQAHIVHKLASTNFGSTELTCMAWAWR